MSNELPGKETSFSPSNLFCSNCGTKQRDEAVFCTECGAMIRADQGVSAAIPPQYYTPPVRRKTNFTFLVLLIIGVLGLITAFLVFFITLGWLYVAAIVIASISGFLLLLGIILMIIELSK